MTRQDQNGEGQGQGEVVLDYPVDAEDTNRAWRVDTRRRWSQRYYPFWLRLKRPVRGEESGWTCRHPIGEWRLS